jgi:hypothetical protein
MSQILSFISENKVVVGAIAIVIIMFGSKVKDLFSKIKSNIPSFKLPASSTQLIDEELLDQYAIRRLRDRANDFADESLIKDIKAIDSKFYDIHAKGKKKDA